MLWAATGIVALATQAAAAVPRYEDLPADSGVADMDLAGVGDVPLPTEAEMLAHYAEWEARVGAGDPAEWAAQIRQHRAAAPGQRRRLQDESRNWNLAAIGALAVRDTTGLDQPAAEELGTQQRIGAVGGCADPLAENYNTNSICTYDCGTLTDHYFPGQAADTTCFIYDPSSGQWPQAGFMDTRTTTLDWHIFVDADPATQPIEFTVGEGRVCSNVTVQISSMSPDVEDEVEEICLYEGVHEHVHTAEGQTVLVTVNSGATVYTNATQASAGATSLFTHGDCEDILIRISGTATSGEVQWTLDDSGHNGPWGFTSSSYPFEHRMCLYDNNFTLSRPADSNWEGTVRVASHTEDYTIRLNKQGNYIVHGTEIDGVPVTLDARLQSGSLPRTQCGEGHFHDRCVAEADEPWGGISRANLIVRYTRWSSRKAPEDPYAAFRMHSMRGPVRLGGGVYIIGGWGSTIMFDNCVFDHMSASSGAGFYIDGEMDEWAREVEAVMSREERAEHAETVRTNLIISNVLFWECDAGWIGGGARVVDSWPLTMNVTDVQLLNNYAIITSAINWAIYAKSFDEGTGIHGDSYVSLKRVEVAENYNSLRNRLEPDDYENRFAPARYHQQPMQFLAFPGHWDESKNWKLTFDIDDYYSHDISAMQQNGLTIYNIVECNCGCFHLSVRDTRFENSWGSGNSLWQSAALLYWGDTAEILRSSFVNNGAIDATKTSTATGVAYLDLKHWAKVHNTQFINGDAASGAGISFMGAGWLEVRDSLFRGNTAWQSGGAISHKGLGVNADGFSLMVLNSIFDSNVVDQDQVDREVEIVVYLYCGSTGTGMGQVNGDENEYLPVWKIDGNDPNEAPFPEGCQQPPYREHFVRKIGNTWQPNYVQRRTPSGQWEDACQDGSVPASETVYGNLTYPFGSYQSEVVKVTVGEHTLWHGMIANQPTPAEQWFGDGFIAIVDILAPVYVRLTDNRNSPDDNGVVRHRDCYTGLRNPGQKEECPVNFDRADPAYSECSDYCRSGETFWSHTDFTVPYGVGGGINILAAQGVSIADSTFTNNIAGKGTAVGVAAATSFTVSNTTYVESDPDGSGDTSPDSQTMDIRNPLTQDDCANAPCSPGFSCSFAQFSLRCDPCLFNAIGMDGIRCSQCEAGLEPNLNNTACIPCTSGKFSTLGFCEDCPVGTTSTPGSQSCAECPAGTAYSVTARTCETCEAGKRAVDGVECEDCEAGKTNSVDHTYCEDCDQGKVRTPGQSECRLCLAGTAADSDAARCMQCSVAGEHSQSGLACTVCPAGTNPTENRTGCVPCARGSAGTGGICTSCDAGKFAPAGSPACYTCPPGTVSGQGGDCLPCAPGSQPTESQDMCISCAVIANTYSVDGMQCSDCPARMQPNRDQTKCDCRTDTYNQVELGVVYCDGLRSQAVSAGLLDECAACPRCLDCSVPGSTRLQPGYAQYGTNDVFRCPGNEETAQAACLGVSLSNVSVSTATWSYSDSGGFPAESMKAQCSEEYSGPICGNCGPEYHHLKVGKPCVSCQQGKVDIPMLIGFIFGAIVAGGVVVTGVYSILVDHGVITDLRLLLGFYQLLAQMDNVLSISFPSPVPELLEVLGFLFLDLRKFIKLDCWDIGGFYGKLTTNVFAMPAVLFGFCVLLYFNQRRTIGAVIAAGGSDESAYRTATVGFKQNIFFAIFLLYPMVTTTLFRVPQCLTLGNDSYHEDDFTIDCQTSSFYAVVTFSIIMIAAIPVGVPLVFLILMFRAKSQLPEGKVNSTVLGGAKLCSADLDDTDDQYGFLCRDLKPRYWYYEIVTYTRKLTLGGLSIFMGRGTLAQAYFVAAVEAGFLAHHMRVYPYVRKQHNQVDALGHAALILTYTVSLVLRSPDDAFLGESFPREGYGLFIVFIYGVVLPLPTIINFYRDTNAKEEDLSSAAVEDEFSLDGGFMNPLSGDTEDSAKETAAMTIATAADTSEPATVSGATLSRLAKAQREKQDLQNEMKEAQVELETLRKEAATFKRSGQVIAMQPGEADADPEAAAVSKEPPPPPPPTEPVQIQALSMKEIMADESLSEEVRESAKQSLEELVSTQLLESKVLTQAITAERMVEAEQRERSVALSKLASEQRYNSQYLATMKKGQESFKASLAGPTAAAARDALVAWLMENRLMHHEKTVLDVAGQHAAIEDFVLLTEEDLAEIGSKMTRVEGLRFAAAVEGLKGSATE